MEAVGNEGKPPKNLVPNRCLRSRFIRRVRQDQGYFAGRVLFNPAALARRQAVDGAAYEKWKAVVERI